MIKACAFNMSPDTHLLDHIAPLASLLQIPLIATEEENARLITDFYPEVNLRFWPDLEFRWREVVDEFDALIECKYWAPHVRAWLADFFGRAPQLWFCPHGQSDKGYKEPLLSPYAEQDRVFIYGDLMQEMLMELGVWDAIASHTRIGNYRLLYHRQNQARQWELTEAQVFSKLNRNNRTLLYAPTWRDADQATSFFSNITQIVQDLPSDWNLIVKVHPLLAERDPALFYRLACLDECRPNFIVVVKFPLIYPILERIDVYLGDYSSIGYDVLAYAKPMFFFQLSHLPSARLHQCGQVIDPQKNVFMSIETGLSRSKEYLPVQQALYKKAFDERAS